MVTIPIAASGPVPVGRNQLDGRPDTEQIAMAVPVGVVPISLDLDGLQLDITQLPSVVQQQILCVGTLSTIVRSRPIEATLHFCVTSNVASMSQVQYHPYESP